MKLKIIILLLLFSALFLAAAERDTLFILHTTDVHGNLLAYDYYKDEVSDRGLSKFHTLINIYRNRHENVILLDGGDMIQGTPLSYLYNHIEVQVTHPLISAMNYLGYDAFTVGNHEIEQGLDVCQRLMSESEFSWLSANSKLDNGTSYFEPYTIIERSGIKVGILGLTTPGIPKWLDNNVYEGINWEDMLITGREHIEYLNNNADVVIGLFHSGLVADDDDTYLPEENASGLVADLIPGFDIVLGGHSHSLSPVDTLIITDTDLPLKLISGHHAQNLGIIKVILESNIDGFRILEKQGWLEPVEQYHESAEMMELFKEQHKLTLDFIRKEVALTDHDLSTEFAYFKDNPLIDLINNVQLKVTNADISFASSFSTSIRIAKGPVRIKDLYSVYPYENLLFTIEMTGNDIKEYLEHSAKFFRLENGYIRISQTISGYNYDMAEGISYKIDVTQPVGKRIKDLIMTDTGEELIDDRVYSVALNSFRGSGGGGFLAAIGSRDPVILERTSKEVRNLIIEFLDKNPDYTFSVNNNWNIIKE